MQILGGGFVSGTTVTVGGLACSVLSLVSASQINCEVPSASNGPVDVTVSVPSATPITKTGAYTYASTAVFSTATDQPIPFIVPTGVTSITVKAWGAGGGGGGVQGANAGGAGGGGGYVYGVIATTPGETLNLYVGQGGLPGGNNGEFGEAGIGSGGAGGGGYYGGGGGGGSTHFCGGSGGGGGSSYIDASVTSGVNTGATSSTAANAADSSYTASAGAGGASATSGNPGLIVISL